MCHCSDAMAQWRGCQICNVDNRCSTSAVPFGRVHSFSNVSVDISQCPVFTLNALHPTRPYDLTTLVILS